MKIKKIVTISDIDKIEKILKRFTEKEKTYRTTLKPRLKIIFIYSEENNKINGYLYAYDIEDGYFRDCFLYDLDTGKKLIKKYADKMIRSLISYCKKEDLDIYATTGTFGYGKSELEVYKKLGFKINKKKKIMEYHLS